MEEAKSGELDKVLDSLPENATLEQLQHFARTALANSAIFKHMNSYEQELSEWRKRGLDREEADSNYVGLQEFKSLEDQEPDVDPLIERERQQWMEVRAPNNLFLPYPVLY